MAVDASVLADVEVRVARPEDEIAGIASKMIQDASKHHEIVERPTEYLEEVIAKGFAMLAFVGTPKNVVGFAFMNTWEGNFISHSGMIVLPEYRGKHLGRLLKNGLMEMQRTRFPDYTIMSLSTNPKVLDMNKSLGFESATAMEMTPDSKFWKSCGTCRNYCAVNDPKNPGGQPNRAGTRCCCTGMILRPNQG